MDRPEPSYAPPPPTFNAPTESKSIEFDKERGKIIVRDPEDGTVTEIDVHRDEWSPNDEPADADLLNRESTAQREEAKGSPRN
jgi:hypothetical protein